MITDKRFRLKSTCAVRSKLRLFQGAHCFFFRLIYSSLLDAGIGNLLQPCRSIFFQTFTRHSYIYSSHRLARTPQNYILKCLRISFFDIVTRIMSLKCLTETVLCTTPLGLETEGALIRAIYFNVSHCFYHPAFMNPFIMMPSFSMLDFMMLTAAIFQKR